VKEGVMRLLMAAFLVCAASLVPFPLTDPHADPPVVTLLGNISFVSPNVGWVGESSSAGYSLFCYQVTSPEPAACHRTTTTIDVTGDGGRTWRRALRIASGPSITLNTLPTAWLRAFDERHVSVLAPAASPRALLYRTADGGTTWTARPLSTRLVYPAVIGADVASVGRSDLWVLERQGAAMGSEAVRLDRSRDAGNHWVEAACAAFDNAPPGYRCPLRSGLTLGGYKDSIAFTSPSDGVLTVEHNDGIPSLSITHDGGVHWSAVMPGFPRGVPAQDVKTGVFPEEQVQPPWFHGSVGVLPARVSVCRRIQGPDGAAYHCTDQSYVLLSHDGGRTWPLSRRLPFTPDPQRSIIWQFIATGTWRATVGATLWSTWDAGAHWSATPSTVPHRYVLVTVQFVTRDTGWAIGAQVDQSDHIAQETRLLRTDDGGRHWAVVSLLHA